MPVEDCAVGLLLELLAKEDRVEDDALGVHAADAELLQELAPALTVERDERVVRRLPVERGTRGGVDVREREVDVVLSIPDQEDPLEEGMATHSSILAWRILWTEEPGGLQSMGLQRQT